MFHVHQRKNLCICSDSKYTPLAIIENEIIITIFNKQNQNLFLKMSTVLKLKT